MIGPNNLIASSLPNSELEWQARIDSVVVAGNELVELIVGVESVLSSVVVGLARSVVAILVFG